MITKEINSVYETVTGSTADTNSAKVAGMRSEGWDVFKHMMASGTERDLNSDLQTISAPGL